MSDKQNVNALTNSKFEKFRACEEGLGEVSEVDLLKIQPHTRGTILIRFNTLFHGNTAVEHSRLRFNI